MPTDSACLPLASTFYSNCQRIAPTAASQMTCSMPNSFLPGICCFLWLFGALIFLTISGCPYFCTPWVEKPADFDWIRIALLGAAALPAISTASFLWTLACRCRASRSCPWSTGSTTACRMPPCSAWRAELFVNCCPGVSYCLSRWQSSWDDCSKEKNSARSMVSGGRSLGRRRDSELAVQGVAPSPSNCW